MSKGLSKKDATNMVDMIKRQNEKIEKLSNALNNIIKHIEIMAPTMAKCSAVWNIAKEALEEK
jgi:hypothetical protein